MWGILPIGSSILAILFLWLLAEPRRVQADITVPREMPERVFRTVGTSADAHTSEVRS
jgi:hypothetical protein